MTLMDKDSMLDGDENGPYSEAVNRVVDLANKLAEENQEADLWDISDGLLMGAIHYWLFARQPCENPMCEDCEPVSNAEHRLAELHRLVDDFARESDYYQSALDVKIGRA